MTYPRYPRYRRLDRWNPLGKFRQLLAGIVDTLDGTEASKTVTSDGVRATRVLTVSGQPGNGETVTIDGVVYTFKTTLSTGPTVAYEVLRGADAAAALTNLKKAINGEATAGTNYSTGTVAHPTVEASAVDSTTLTARARAYGTAGNSIALAETLSAGSWASGTLTGGAQANIFSASSHGWALGEGPFYMTAGTTLPTGIPSATTPLYIAEVTSASKVKFGFKVNGVVVAANVTDVGSGTLTIKRAVDQAGILNTLRRAPLAKVQAASDIDGL